MKRSFAGGSVCVIAALFLAACGSVPPVPVTDRAGSATVVEGRGKSAAAPGIDGPSYTIKRGDTLFAIALDQGLDYRELAQWNNLDNPDRLLVGQVLRLSAPTALAGASDSGVQIKPVAATPTVQIKSLDPAVTSAPAPTATTAPIVIVADNSSTLKRTPKGGTQPYSEEALARQKQIDGTDGKGTALATAPVPIAPSPAAVPPAVQPTGSAPAPASAPVPAPPAQAAPALPATPPVAASAVSWLWPAPGKVLVGFSEGANKGIDIAGKPGEPVLAAAAGKISYVGSSLRGYGKMVVVKHPGEFLSVYAHNNNVLVKEGESVSAGQKIAELGSTDTDSPKLHFEIRRQGKPVDPIGLLPPR
ncbi:MAG: peptidoglycan DD-metalloendopeptidase family protein [Rhodocyclaceae bacterium]|nr:peptidoglycan DD-metalloendopeptidase family protein [Rhodocyclaceae bacterium]